MTNLNHAERFYLTGTVLFLIIDIALGLNAIGAMP